MIAPHCLIERHRSASRFPGRLSSTHEKWFRRRNKLLRLFSRVPGRWALASRAIAAIGRQKDRDAWGITERPTLTELLPR